MNDHDIHKHFSGNVCKTCGGDAPGWKCPECGFTSMKFDPSHFQNCKHGSKMQAQCQACGEAESKCSC